MSKSAGYIRNMILLGMLGLTGCGTAEYRAERKHCEAEWMLKVPPVYGEKAVTKYRDEQRLTGKTSCNTEGSVTTCEQVIETVSVPYLTMETVDFRKPQRDPQIASCAARACMAGYGNSDCKT